MSRAMLAVFIAGLLLSPIALAQSGTFGKPDEKQAGKKQDKKKDTKKDEKKKGTQVDRMLTDLKSLIAREKAKPEFDKELVKDLEVLVRSHEKNKEPVKLEDLSEEDRRRLEREVREKIAAEQRERRGDGRDPAAGGGADRWAQGRVDRVLDAVKLKEDQKQKVSGLLVDFAKDIGVAYQNSDFKLVSDLKKDLERSLKKAVGHKKAKDIMNEVNKNFGGRRGGWGGR